jgi:hypothetical protein
MCGPSFSHRSIAAVSDQVGFDEALRDKHAQVVEDVAKPECDNSRFAWEFRHRSVRIEPAKPLRDCVSLTRETPELGE